MNAFTRTYDGRAERLITACWISRVCEDASIWGPGGFETPGEFIETEIANGERIRLQKFNSLWDTGASQSVISPRVVDICDLTPIGTAEIQARLRRYPSSAFQVNIGLPSNTMLTGVPVAVGLELPGVDVIIGMDVISQGDFAVTNQNEKTVFSFRIPSLASIDFLNP